MPPESINYNKNLYSLSLMIIQKESLKIFMQPKEDYIRWMWNAYYKLEIIIAILKESLDKLHVTSIESIHCLFVPQGDELNE